MEANEFVAKLKSNGSKNDICDLGQVHVDFKKISSDLPCKDKGSFAVNVLCILCRNLDKAPTWCSNIDTKDLVVLSVDCIRDTRTLGQTDRVKVLACVFHIHRHVVRQDTSIPPELVLKLSYMPFEADATNFLTEYAKTYWNILADRILYIEKLKSQKLAIIKLLAKLTEDIDKVIQRYDTVQFCNNILTFLIKKLFFLYNDFYAKHLNAAYKSIFQAVSSKKDLKNFKSLSEKDVLGLYVKLNEAFYVIVENNSKINFQQSILQDVVQTFISLIGHRPDIFHCIQAIHLISFCSIFTDKPNFTFTENILRNLLLSCETTEKLRCNKAMVCTYPYIYQLLRFYIEYCVSICDKAQWQDLFTIESQECCLKLILLLMEKMKSLEQLLKCENCNVRNGLHDSLRLSFSAKHFIVVSINKSMDIKPILPLYFTVIQEQDNIMNGLNELGCSNYEKCFKKAQADIHNTAILLNKACYYEYSINTFNFYLKNEIKCCKLEADRKNISRGFYNKAICELDFKLYDNALQSAYFSFLFAQPVGIHSEKYISLVIDIKAKILKNKTEIEEEKEAKETNPDTFQLITVLDACQMVMETDSFGDLQRFFKDLNFNLLLKHEFSMYAKLWPSVVPIAGVWIALNKISENSSEKPSNRKEANAILQEIIIETPTAVRTIQNEYFSSIIKKISSDFQPKTVKEKLLLSTILLLKCEFDLAEASEKYGWKGTEQTETDVTSTRTIAREHKALADGVKAVELMTDVLPDLKKSPTAPYLCHVLAVSQVSVPHLLLYNRHAHALQLAYICCEMADLVGDAESYTRNAGVLLYHARPHSQLEALCKMASQRAKGLTRCGAEGTALGFFCDVAIYYVRCGMKSEAAELVLYVQAAILEASENEKDVNLDLVIGRLLEAQTMLCQDTPTLDEPTLLTAVFETQRHYLTITNNCVKYSSRRLQSLSVRQRCARATLRCALAARALLLWRRARVATPAAGAAHAHAAVCSFDTVQAQVIIDNCLKHALGLPTNESLNTLNQPTSKHTHTFTPKRELFEAIRDAQIFNNNQTSPTLPFFSVPGFHMPEFCTHVASCKCYACETPTSFILACQTTGLEASVYFRAKEFNIAKNYYDGVLEMFGYVESKLAHAKRAYENMNFEACVVDTVDAMHKVEFKNAQISILIEATLFELAQRNYEKADDLVVWMHEILKELDKENAYFRAEFYNLMCASAKLRKVVKRATEEIGLEKELENLKLSPDKPQQANPPKTPEERAPIVPKLPKIVLKDEELPNAKRKVIKLNLDEIPEEPKATKRTSNRPEFKIPVPITSKAIPENITPRPTRKPKLLLTQPSVDIKETLQTPTQNDSKVEFFTPIETPCEEFFTPNTSTKTYSKKSLRQNIVKNLEQEFSTSESAKENEGKTKVPRKSLLAVPKRVKGKVETGSIRTLKDKRTELKRSTSPGQLKNDKKLSPTKTRRQLRKPVKFSLEGDEKLPRN